MYADFDLRISCFHENLKLLKLQLKAYIEKKYMVKKFSELKI